MHAFAYNESAIYSGWPILDKKHTQVWQFDLQLFKLAFSFYPPPQKKYQFFVKILLSHLNDWQRIRTFGPNGIGPRKKSFLSSVFFEAFYDPLLCRSVSSRSRSNIIQKNVIVRFSDLQPVWPEKNRQMSLNVAQNDFTRKMIDFDTITKIA